MMSPGQALEQKKAIALASIDAPPSKDDCDPVSTTVGQSRSCRYM